MLKRRVLVVDDLVDGADTMADLLRVIGHEVRTAYDGNEAVEAAKTFKPDLILCDIGMPKLNGYEACRRIRAELGGAEIFMVALTGWGQPSDRARSREAGFDLHVVKPFDSSTIQALLDSCQVANRLKDRESGR